jgi:hypothetical protein
MTGSAEPIPAIREKDAAGEVAAIFADLRATLGVPFADLISRHLATIPGGIAWTWGLLRPLYLAPNLAPPPMPCAKDFICATFPFSKVSSATRPASTRARDPCPRS